MSLPSTGGRTPGQPRIDPIAGASLGAAVLGAAVWWAVGGWALWLFATAALTLGIVALVRIRRNGQAGRIAAVIGVAFGLVYYVLILKLLAETLAPLFDPGASPTR